MPNSRGPASARPDPSVAAGSRLPGASGPPSTPLRDLIGVRTASQVTPLSGNVRKRQKDALLTEQQQTPTRPSPGGTSAAGQQTNLSASNAAAPSQAVDTSPSLSTPLQPQPEVQHPQQPDLPAQGSQAAAAAPVSSSPAPSSTSGPPVRPQATRKPPGPRPARPTPAPVSAPRARSSKPHIPERLRDYRLLSSTTSNAFDVAARGGIQDNRIFVKLREDHAARKAATERFWRLRDTINTGLSRVGLTDAVSSVDAVKTGLALTLARGCKTSEVMQHADFLKRFLNADDVVTRKPAILRVIGNVPVRVGGRVVDALNGPSLEREITIALNAKLVCPPRRMCKPDDLESCKTTAVWVALNGDDPDAARPRRIRLLQQWCTIRPFESRSTTTPCDKCWRYGHSVDTCSHAPRCRQCGSSAHSTEEHSCTICGENGADRCVPLCSSCSGPHIPGTSGCKARPIFDDTVNSFILPVGQRLHQIKRAAHHERQQAIKSLQSSTTTNPTTNP